MLKVISIKRTYICDRCGRYGEKNAGGPFDDGSLHIRRTESTPRPSVEGLGSQSRTYDLCRLCTNSINRTSADKRPVALANWRSIWRSNHLQPDNGMFDRSRPVVKTLPAERRSSFTGSAPTPADNLEPSKRPDSLDHQESGKRG